MIAFIALLASAQIQRVETAFDVYSIQPGSSPKRIGESRLASSMSLKRGRNIVWSYLAHESKSGWRKEWTYDSTAQLTFQSYEVSFGDLRSRWNLSREEGRWSLTGSKSIELPKKMSSVADASSLWFVEKKVAPGASVRIAAIDSGTFEVRKGMAKYLRDEEWKVEVRPFAVRVYEKRFDDETQVWYCGDGGEVWRIDLVFPNSSANLVFIDRRLPPL